MNRSKGKDEEGGGGGVDLALPFSHYILCVPNGFARYLKWFTVPKILTWNLLIFESDCRIFSKVLFLLSSVNFRLYLVAFIF